MTKSNALNGLELALSYCLLSNLVGTRGAGKTNNMCSEVGQEQPKTPVITLWYHGQHEGSTHAPKTNQSPILAAKTSVCIVRWK